jgi:hypothetical protein
VSVYHACEPKGTSFLLLPLLLVSDISPSSWSEESLLQVSADDIGQRNPTSGMPIHLAFHLYEWAGLGPRYRDAAPQQCWCPESVKNINVTDPIFGPGFEEEL